MKLYAEISKVEPQDDGTLKVWGYASSGAVDSDGETITSDAMKAAIPDYMKFGAVREMHQQSAAGTAIEASVGDDGKTFFGAHVVDPIAVKKVQTGTYKGFSIGGKVTERDATDKKIIKGLKLVEVSLVDRPANPDAIFTVYKAEKLAEDDVNELAEILDKGEISPAKILELIKASKNPPLSAAEQATADAVKAGVAELKKGFSSLSDFACVLSSISYLTSDSEWESQFEGDGSPVPASLRGWLADGLKIFQDMAAEEAKEMVSALNAAAGADTEIIIELAEQKLSLKKSGATFSGKTKKALGDIHKAAQDVCDKFDALGYKGDDEDKDDDDAEMAASIEIGKAAAAEVLAKSEELSKVTGERDELQKDADILKARVAQLEAMPAAGKALLKAISKGDDVGDEVATAAKIEPVLDAKGETNEVASLIKAAHRSGGVRH